jgi:hypothetical protein
MKKVIILLIVLAALIGVALVTRDTSENRLKPAAAREKLLKDLDVNAVRKIRIKEGDKTTSLALTGDQWTVAERSNYPAAFEKIGKMLMELKDQKTGKQRTYGKGAWGDLKLNEPGQGKADEGGLLIELLGDGDKELSAIVLGKNVTSSTVGKEASPFGGGGNQRYVRVKGDESTVWVVENQFYELQSKPEDWIDKSFIDVAKIKEVEVTAPKAEDSWKASRESEASSDFTLAGGKGDEELDSSKAALASILANPSFTDVVPKEKAAADFMKDAWTAKISTFEGFTYTLKLLKKGSGSDEKHYMTVAVAGNFAKERPPVKDEKPEDKKKNDEEFAATKKTLEEKLAKEKKAEGWVFEISSYTIGSLLKKKSEVLKDKAPPPSSAPAQGQSGSPVGLPSAPSAVMPRPTPPKPAPVSPPAPPAEPAPAKPAPAPAKTPISVTTPPVSVPAPAGTPTPPKPELKAPPSDPIPKVEPKPAVPPAPGPAPAAAPAKHEEPKK